jgi:bifunctional polynucleotide phosphatase/kinase
MFPVIFLQKILQVMLDYNSSFFVGDAAGRPGDHADTDRKWAMNIGISFYTPQVDRAIIFHVYIVEFILGQEYFLKCAPTPFVLNGFHVSTLPQCVLGFFFLSILLQLPQFLVLPLTPTLTPLLPPPPRSKPELVLFCGYPSLGKTSFFRLHFLPEDYAHINQDTLRTRQKCLEAVEAALAADRNCVVGEFNSCNDKSGDFIYDLR